MVLTMKNIEMRVVFLLILSLFTGLVYGQRSDLLYAESQYSQQNYRKAAVEFSKVYLETSSYELAKKIAISYDAIYEFGDSQVWWGKAVGFDTSTREDYLSYLISSRRIDPEFDAVSLLLGSPFRVEDFPELAPVVSVSSVPFRKFSLSNVSELNSVDSDYGLHILSSGKRLFASNRGEVLDVKKKLIRLDAVSPSIKKDNYHLDERNYYSLYSQVSGEDAVKIDVEGFELYHLSDPMVVAGTNTVFFTATPNRIRRKDEVIYPGIYRGTFEEDSNKIVDVVSFVLNKTNEYGVMSGVVDPVEQVLYFSSNIAGGLGGYDLYRISYDMDWVFGDAINMGSYVNTAGNERDAHIDGGYLYFSSDGRTGFGGLDIYRVLVGGSIALGEAENLGDPINTVWDDFGFQLSGSNTAYLNSDRLDGLGYDDFYRVDWKDKKIRFEARSTDQVVYKELPELKVEVLAGGVPQSVSLEELAVLLVDAGELEVILSHPGHFRTDEKLVLNADEDLVLLNLVAIPYDLDVYDAIIYYDLDKYFLRDLSKEKLDEVTALMSRHSELFLDISSHTDSRASMKYNEKLSERRARSVTKYLDGNGVDDARISSAWYSETRLLNDCGDGVPCPLSYHDINRRSELVLRVFEDRSKEYALPMGAKASDFATPESARKWFSQK